ncbi:pimeloyl-ACP methyl ester esterase BioH [Methylophaga sp. OBS3]|uniref:pimeloyl-ACP methyl ester esterase BioH n=1 Tax=Methylophaga sp. OBS3 TaxID=2991934 RepID=UPI0022584CEF|nr:pimeloyl-ACP methyl ester esterase BioH [Methylophaga sp. OBS3]MCX4190679.1 pimeloyl-ACP methyl ester esterase BioH [Methylophaga sp. OBS3]
MFIERSGNGPDLVLIHGWSMNRHVWKCIKPMLENDFTLHCVDLPGHGDSDWQINGLEMSSVIAEFAAKLPEKCSMIGWSMGGQFAMEFAKHYPERVSKLLCIAATPKFVADEKWPTAMPVETFGAFSEGLAQDPQQLMQSFLKLQARGAESSRETIKILRDDVLASKAAHPEALRDGLICLAEFDGRKLLADLTVPVSFLLAEKDNLIPVTLADALIRLNADIHCQVIEGAGHAPFISHPEQTATLIKSMLHG